jgi:anthranilate phosphoribosyltransferase
MRTAFNLVGPLTNPAGAPRQLVGVSDPAAAERVALALAALGAGAALLARWLRGPAPADKQG